jgi:hypothetical protein
MWAALALLLGLLSPAHAQTVFLRAPLPAPGSLRQSAFASVARQGAIGCLNVAEPADLSDIVPLVPERLAALLDGRARVVLIADRPPPGQLGLVALAGPGIPPGTLLRSPTTRTPGLIAAIDLTPAGRPLQFLEVDDAVDATERFAQRVAATQAATVPVLSTYGVLAGIALVLGLMAVLRPHATRAARAALTLATGGTVALLAIGIVPVSPPLLPVVFVVLSAALALAATGLARHRAIDALLCLLVGSLLIDAARGAPLVAHSPLSGYYLAGIRYYGIGNEFMGLLIGAALMSVPRRALVPMGFLVIAALGLPFFGANAGGAMSAAAGFALLGRGRARWLGVVGAVVATAVLLALIDRLQPDSVQSHIGQAAGRGPGAWGAIVLGKLAMNARLARAPGTLIALAAVVPAAFLLVRGAIGQRVQQALAAAPDRAGRLPAALGAAGAALVFNDSGIVAALLLLAPVLVTVIETALCASLPSISEPSGSVSPPAMNTSSEPLP